MKSLVTEIIAERLGPITVDFPDASYKNEAAGVLPTPVLSEFMTSYHYTVLRFLEEAGISINGSIDNITNNQFWDAYVANTNKLQRVHDGDDLTTAAWSAGTYGVGDVVRHLNLNWYCGVVSTTDEPGVNSDWVMSENLSVSLKKSTFGVEQGGFLPLNDIDHADYTTTYRVGSHVINSVDYEAWWLNLDGTAHTTASSDAGKLLDYCKFKSLISSELAGTTTLFDYSALFSRSVGNKAGLLGALQFHAFQGHYHSPLSASSIIEGPGGPADAPQATGTASWGAVPGVGSPITDGVSGTPNTDTETRPRNFAQGVWGIVIIAPKSIINP